MPTKIFVGNLAAETQSDDIRVLFQKYGKVTECDVLNRYGFVHMQSEEQALTAIGALSGLDVHGSKINVELSHGKQKNRDSDNYGRGGGRGGGGRGGSRGGMRGGGRGRGAGPMGGPPRSRAAYDPYPMDRYADRYDDYYRYERARAFSDPYERERRPLPGERPLPPLYDRRPLPGGRMTPPTDPYRRPPPEYYDRRRYDDVYGYLRESGYETGYEGAARRELPSQLSREHALAELAARERDPYLAREREYALADREDAFRALSARDPYAREREPAGNGYDYRRYEAAQTTSYPEYSQRSSYGEGGYGGAGASAYGSAATGATAGYGATSGASAYDGYSRDPYAAQRGGQDGYSQSSGQAGGTKMDQSFLAKAPIFF